MELNQTFDKYDFHNVYERIGQLEMEFSEFVEDFMHQFLHLFYEFLKGDIDSDFMMENFRV